ncbi:MAG TPA: VTT domain-containing protein [Clostridia bacterium]|nr:VTT domain-containing protein [Clostridia bacterium]HRX42022.1 VTT domain-containing protein [Clostridia bacterium]
MLDWLKKYKQRIFSIIVIVLMVVLIVIMCIDLIPLIKNIFAHTNDENSVVSIIDSYGSKGVFILISLGALQIISAVISAVPIQILAGLAYDVFYGFLICLTGFLLGNVMVFVLVRQIKVALNFKWLKREDKLTKSRWDFSFIRKSDNLMFMAFLLFLIPGVPNGILPYIFANTRISLPKFLLCAVTAGSPTILLSIYVGDRISKGDVKTAAITAAILIGMSLLVVLMRKKILALIKRLSKKSETGANAIGKNDQLP